MGGLLFAVDDGAFTAGKAGGAEQGDEFGFGKTEPKVGVEFAGFLEVVAEEVEDGDASAGAENAEGFGEGAFGVGGVVEGLGEEGDVDARIVDGELFHVAEAVIEVGKAVFSCEIGAVFDHFFAAVDGDDALGTLGEELRDGALAGAEVGDDERGEELKEGFGESAPTAPGDVVAPELARKFIKIGANLVAAAGEDEVEGFGVEGGFGDFECALAEDVEQSRDGEGAKAVKDVLAGAAILDQIFRFQVGEVGGDGALAETEDFLEFGDREFFPFKEEEEAEPVGVGEEAKSFED